MQNFGKEPSSSHGPQVNRWKPWCSGLFRWGIPILMADFAVIPRM